MKKLTEILIISGALIFLGVSIFLGSEKTGLIVGAPTLSYQKSLLPITTNLYDVGSSTQSKIWNRLFVNYASTTAITATTASSTNLILSGLLNCNTIDTSANGTLSCGTDDAGTGAPFAWTPTADGNSTSTRLIFGNGFISQASSTFSNTGTTTFSGDIDVRQLQVTGSNIYGDTSVSHITLSSTEGSSIDYHNGGGENKVAVTGGIIQNITNGSEVSRFNSTGLGIFDTSPTYALDVTGDGHFTSFADAAYFVATSTTASTFPKVSITEATTTSLSITGLFNIGGDYLNELCGTGLTCTGNTLALNATGDWTGTIDGNNFAGGAIGAGELIYGGSAGSFSELALGTNGYVLALSGGIPAWVASTTFSGGLTYSGGNVTADLGTSVTLTSEVDGILPIANGGTNASSFTTSGNSLYYTGSALATAPLTSKTTTPYASSTALSVSSYFSIDASGNLLIPSTAPNEAQEIGITSNQFQFVGANGLVQAVTGTTSPAFNLASTTLDALGFNTSIGTTTLILKNDPEAITLLGFYCTATTTGSSVTALVRFGDGTNWTEDGTCPTTGQFTRTTVNNTFTRFENFIVQASSTGAKASRMTITTVLNK